MASCDGTIVAEQMNQWRHPGRAGGRGACGREGWGEQGQMDPFSHLITPTTPSS